MSHSIFTIEHTLSEKTSALFDARSLQLQINDKINKDLQSVDIKLNAVDATTIIHLQFKN